MIGTTLNDAILAAVDAQLGGMHVCLPGAIDTYDPKLQKANVKPLLKRNYVDGAKSLPVITSVPVVWPRGGGASLTFPLTRGDGVLLVFSERSLELWLDSGGETKPGDARRFDLSDAIAIPGLTPFNAAPAAEDADSVLLKYKDFKLKIAKDGKIAIGKGGDELMAIVSDLCKQVSTIADLLSQAKTPTFIGPQPLIQAPMFAQAKTQVDSIKTKIDAIKGKL